MLQNLHYSWLFTGLIIWYITFTVNEITTDSGLSMRSTNSQLLVMWKTTTKTTLFWKVKKDDWINGLCHARIWFCTKWSTRWVADSKIFKVQLGWTQSTGQGLSHDQLSQTLLVYSLMQLESRNVYQCRYKDKKWLVQYLGFYVVQMQIKDLTSWNANSQKSNFA